MTDIETICAAIDANDDSALLALADTLEEAGDFRAAGMRLVTERHYAPYHYAMLGVVVFEWHKNRGGLGFFDDAILPEGLFDLLPNQPHGSPSPWRASTRSSAYLALAYAFRVVYYPVSTDWVSGESYLSTCCGPFDTEEEVHDYWRSPSGQEMCLMLQASPQVGAYQDGKQVAVLPIPAGLHWGQ